ncbi:hypothetical protein [Microvirga yunnanensis]|uniref:hypothetical protein n=1 Tax=Microvirga yunnanensis TaxID=2953740 RepID=UPI0021C9C9E7|nr:hypothetical protein [Microvirga sp. HBU65207]
MDEKQERDAQDAQDIEDFGASSLSRKNAGHRDGRRDQQKKRIDLAHGRFLAGDSQNPEEAVDDDPNEDRVQRDPKDGTDKAAQADRRIAYGLISEEALKHGGSHQSFLPLLPRS